MNAAAMQVMFRYHHWANRKVWECIVPLSDAQFHQEHDYSHGSLCQQAYHLMVSELYTLAIVDPAIYDEYQALQSGDFTTRDALRTQWDAYVVRLDAMLDTLIDDDLQASAGMPSRRGTVFTVPLWQCFMTMIDHATDHRAQMLALIHSLGGATCEQGFFFYLLERDQAPA